MKLKTPRFVLQGHKVEEVEPLPFFIGQGSTSLRHCAICRFGKDTIMVAFRVSLGTLSPVLSLSKGPPFTYPASSCRGPRFQPNLEPLWESACARSNH